MINTISPHFFDVRKFGPHLSIFSMRPGDVCVTQMTVFFCRLHLSLKTCLSRGHVTKFPFPSSSLKSSETLKRNMFSSLVSACIHPEPHFGTLRNAVAKLYRILPTCAQRSPNYNRGSACVYVGRWLFSPRWFAYQVQCFHTSCRVHSICLIDVD